MQLIICHRVNFVAIHDTSLRVKDVWSHGEWDLSNVITWLPQEVEQDIRATIIHINAQLPDCYVWQQNVSGEYTAKSGYLWLWGQQNMENVEAQWRWIWKIVGPENIRFFIWLCCHNALPTNELRCKRGLTTSAACPRCMANDETVFHCIRDCSSAIEIWRTMGFSVNDAVFLTSNIVEWFKYFLGYDAPRFTATIWWIWRSRNSVCMESVVIPTATIISNALSLMNLIVRSATRNQHVETVTRWVSWRPSIVDHVVLNVDGSSLGNPGLAGFGGCFRNHLGGWILGFSGFYGVSEILHMELLAILNGLSIAWERGYRNVECQSDSQHAIQLIRDHTSMFHKYATILGSIKDLLAKDWTVSVSHCLREGNQCADYLAKMRATSDQKLIVLDHPPSGLLPALTADSAGILFPRV